MGSCFLVQLGFHRFAFWILLCVVLGAVHLDSAGLEIVNAPVGNTNAPEGTSFTFSVVAAGEEPLTYQWFKEGSPIADANSAQLTLPNPQGADSGIYEVTVSDASGSSLRAGAVLIVRPRIPIITSVSPSQNIPVGGELRLVVFVAAVSPVTYEWYKNGEQISRSAGSDLFISNVTSQDAGNYTVKVSNAYGASTSEPIPITVGDPPVENEPAIVDHPSWLNMRESETAPISVGATGAPPLTYQWFKDGQSIQGATNSILWFRNASVSQSGSYTVVVQNSFGSVTSNPSKVIVTEHPPPTITVQPVGKIDLLSSELPYRLTVEAMGTFPLRFIWYRDGHPVRESMASRVMHRAVDTFSIYGWGDNGEYRVVAMDGFGTARSASARVEVKVPSPKRPASTESPDLLLGLIAYWPFDEIVDGATKDFVGPYDLRLSAPYFTGGRVGNALPLGVTATYHAEDPADELPANRHAAFTVSFWAGYATRMGRSPEHVLFYEGNTKDAETFFSLSAPPLSSSLYSSRFQIATDPLSRSDLQGSSIILSDRSWHHLVIVQDADGTRWFYIDGEEDSLPLPIKAPSAWNLDFLQFGGEVATQAGHHSMGRGYIPNEYKLDDAAVWKRALSVEEIRLLMRSGIPGYEPKLLKIESLSVDQERKSLTIHWNAASIAFHSLLMSTNANGPWTMVTNAYSSGLNGFTVTNAFTGLEVTDGAVFYKIQQGGQ